VTDEPSPAKRQREARCKLHDMCNLQRFHVRQWVYWAPHRQPNIPDSPTPGPTFVIWYFAFYSPMLLSMFQGPSARKCFVVACKKCRRDVPTGVGEFPFQSIVVECPLCGEKRRYLPSEVFLGRGDQLVNRQKRAGAI
jgi:hypothetical protein